MEVGGEGDYILIAHRYHQNDFSIKMGNDERQVNIS